MSGVRKVVRRVTSMTMAVTVVAVGLVGIGVPAEAYHRFGCTWPSRTITIAWGTLPKGYSTAVSGARADWSGHTDVYLRRISSTTRANIVVAVRNYGNTGWSGTAEGANACSAGKYKQRIPARVNRYYTDGYPAWLRRSVVTHEIGHALGLAHQGTVKSACKNTTIMNPTDTRRMQCHVYTTRADDRRGVNSLY